MCVGLYVFKDYFLKTWHYVIDSLVFEMCAGIVHYQTSVASALD